MWPGRNANPLGDLTMTNPSHSDPRPADAHAAHLQHHFTTPAQQFESAALGMWLFLITEILLFGGLFCAYAVYRANHPEIFVYAHVYLDKVLGGVNTIILLCSSFTMAAGVWAAQHGRRRLLSTMLALTILCGCGFLGIKYVEYKHKWEEGLLWGKYYRPHVQPGAHSPADARATRAAEQAATAPVAAGAPPAMDTGKTAAAPTAVATPSAADAPSAAFRPPDLGPSGLRAPGSPPEPLAPAAKVHNVQTFFGIYFSLTGLHGLHVVAGLITIGWLLWRAVRGDFSAAYFTPVPMVGLYWHVVDIIWIYLFPLLYLIH